MVNTKAAPAWGRNRPSPRFMLDRSVDLACADQAPEVFFQEALTGLAKAVCGRCEAKPACEAWALGQNPTYLFGVWGGTSQSDREEWHRRRRGLVPDG